MMKQLNASEKKERITKWWQKKNQCCKSPSLCHQMGSDRRQTSGNQNPHSISSARQHTQMRDCNIQKLTDIKPFIDRLLRFPKNMRHLSLFQFLSQFRVRKNRAWNSKHTSRPVLISANVTQLKATAKQRVRNINNLCYRPRWGQGF